MYIRTSITIQQAHIHLNITNGCKSDKGNTKGAYFKKLIHYYVLLLLLPVRHWKAYTEGTKPVGRIYLKPRGIK